MQCIFFSLSAPETVPTECTARGYTVLSETNRYWSYDDGSNNCDSGVIVTDQWYRFSGAAGEMMSSDCIPIQSCNTDMAGWISGSHPSLVFEMTWPSVCMHYSSSCCHKSYSVAIRNCSEFYVYKLKAPSSCNERYCGVKGK